MPQGNSIINLGDLAKPATVLIEKISDAIGGGFKPYQIKRVAKAEAEADIIKAQAQIKITDIQHRALIRFLAEEGLKQDNIEEITRKAIPQLEGSSNPKNIENDWIVNFFDKCRIISDEEMQSLWAKVLAGEANSPGMYSKRTVNFLSSLDKNDAELFTSLCKFSWLIEDGIVPLVFDEIDPIYNNQGINFETLSHLDDIGLINFNSNGDFCGIGFPKNITIFYHGAPLYIEFIEEKENSLITGRVFLTKTGTQLAPICGSKPVENFYDYAIKMWQQDNKYALASDSPLPKLIEL